MTVLGTSCVHFLFYYGTEMKEAPICLLFLEELWHVTTAKVKKASLPAHLKKSRAQLYNESVYFAVGYGPMHTSEGKYS